MNKTETTSIKRTFFGLAAVGLLAMSACYGEEADDQREQQANTAQDVAALTAGPVSQGNPCDDPTTATIIGTAGDDYLLGTQGDDIIFGLGGDDIILGKGGNDILCGGPGNDSILGGPGDDEVYGEAGYNWLKGNDGDDTLFGGDDGNEIQGNAGADTVLGGLGADTLYGGGDDDVLHGDGGDDDMYGNAGDDRLFGDDDNDRMYGGSGNDCLDGGNGDDRLHGEDGDDCLNGSNGIDQLACGAGADTYDQGEWDFSGCETAGTCYCDNTMCENLNETFADNAAGWTLDTEWAIAPALASSGGTSGSCAGSADPGQDHTPDTTDNGVAGVVVGGTAQQVTHGYYYLTSPAVDTTGQPDLSLEYWRWLVSDYSPYMVNQVQVWDGNGWQTLYQTSTSPGVTDSSWTQQQFDISAYSNAALRVRFGFSIGSAGVWSCPSWSLDDVRIFSPTVCGVPPIQSGQ